MLKYNTLNFLLLVDIITNNIENLKIKNPYEH